MYWGAFISWTKLLFVISIGSKLLFVFSIGWLMNVMFVSSICILTLGLCSRFYNDFIVSKRSPSEVQNWTSFGLLFDTWIEDTHCEEEFGPNQEHKAEFVATNECASRECQNHCSLGILFVMSLCNLTWPSEITNRSERHYWMRSWLSLSNIRRRFQ